MLHMFHLNSQSTTDLHCEVCKHAKHLLGKKERDSETCIYNEINYRDKRAKLDPKDYSISNVTGETAGKLPGEINGQQFIIQNCQVF